jgi:hypothetical protein
VVLVVLQARGDEGHVQAARRADRLVLLRLGARSELARVAAPFSEGEQGSADAAKKKRARASREHDRGIPDLSLDRMPPRAYPARPPRLRWQTARFNNLEIGEMYKVKFNTTADPSHTVRKLKFQGYQLPMGPGDRLGYLFEVVEQGVRRLITMYRRIPALLMPAIVTNGFVAHVIRSVRGQYVYRLGARGRDL